MANVNVVTVVPVRLAQELSKKKKIQDERHKLPQLNQ